MMLLPLLMLGRCSCELVCIMHLPIKGGEQIATHPLPKRSGQRASTRARFRRRRLQWHSTFWLCNNSPVSEGQQILQASDLLQRLPRVSRECATSSILSVRCSEWSPSALRQEYDSLWSLPAIAPRPLLVANGALDPRCPVNPKSAGMLALSTGA